MAKIYLAIDTKQDDLQRIVLEHALRGKDRWIFIHVHPRIARLLERIEETGFGHVSFDVRDSLPENVNITRGCTLEV